MVASIPCVSSLHTCPRQCSTAQIEAATLALHQQWARGGTVEDYRAKLVCHNENETATHCASSSTDRRKSADGSGDTDDSSLHVNKTHLPSQPQQQHQQQQEHLPSSYLLVLEEGTVVGHGRLTECFEGAGGRAAAATFVLIFPPAQRGKGYGSLLMKLLEDKAVALGYHYMYLWTAAAVPFYKQIGYSPTERVSLFSACLKTLQCDHVMNLEAMLLVKRKTFTSSKSSSSAKTHETVMLPPDTEATDEDVWLRKRLIESLPSCLPVRKERRIEEMYAAIHKYCSAGDGTGWQRLQWEYSVQHVPWQQQVGPSCGLAALRMLRDYYYSSKDDDDDSTQAIPAQQLQQQQSNATKMPSLLAEAQKQGYTVDGEVFVASYLHKLAFFAGLDCEMESFRATPPSRMLNILQAGGTLILPYDSQPCTKQPCQNQGKTAHYGVIVGVLLGFAVKESAGRSGDSSSSITVPSSTKISSTDAPFLVEHSVNSSCVDKADAILLLVQHSLSPNWAIAPCSTFYESNQQLTAIDATKYKLPEGTSLNLRDCLLICHGRVKTY